MWPFDFFAAVKLELLWSWCIRDVYCITPALSWSY